MTTTANVVAPEVDVATVPSIFSPQANLTDSAVEMAANVAGLVNDLRVQADQAERDRTLTPEISARLGALGVWDLATPENFGGYAAGARDLVEILSQVGRGDGSAGWLAAAAANHNMLVLAYPAEVVSEVFNGLSLKGPRMVAASVFARQLGTARPVDGGWMVKGKWGFATCCRTADWAMVGVEVEGGGGSGRGLALLRAEDFAIINDWHTAGMAATGSNSIIVEQEVFVPGARLFDITELSVRLNGLKGQYRGACFQWPEQARMVVITMNLAAIALGMAEGALDVFTDLAPKRKPFNLPYATIADCPGAQISAGRSRARIDAARAVVERVADGVDRLGELDCDVSHQEATRLHMDLVFAIRLSAEAIADLEEALGTSSYALSNPIQRFHRDVRVLASHGAVRFDPLAELNGADILGRGNDPKFAANLPPDVVQSKDVSARDAAPAPIG